MDTQIVPDDLHLQGLEEKGVPTPQSSPMGSSLASLAPAFFSSQGEQGAWKLREAESVSRSRETSRVGGAGMSRRMKTACRP